MKKSLFTETQIVSILGEADASMKVNDLCREHGFSPAIYYNWKSSLSLYGKRYSCGLTSL